MTQLLTWLGIITCLFALFSLIILYFQGFFRPRTPYRIHNLPPPGAPNFGLTVASLSDSFLSQGTTTGFWLEAEEINAARLKAIHSAQESIQFETYTMTPGRRADDFAAALAEQAQAGVKVQVIADNYGAHKLSPQYWQRLQATGVQVRFFNRFTWRDPVYHLKRNHRKLLLIDQRIALIGGAGVSDDWDGLGDKYQAPWLDYEVCWQGAVIARLKGLFLQHWLDAGGTAYLEEVIVPIKENNESTVIITSGEDPTQRDSDIRALFQSLIQSAKERIWIASPYFLPNANSRNLLVKAQQQGVEVRILTMGERSDKPFIHYASRELYHSLLEGKIAIYEYQPSMMHAKAILVDNHWVSLGSANFDPRSFFHNDELNLSTTNPQLVEQIEQFFLNAFNKSQKINWQQWQSRPWLERLRGRFWLLFYWQL